MTQTRKLLSAIAVMAIALALSTLAPTATSVAREGVPRPETTTPRGVAAPLRDGAPDDRVRVRILLGRQPVLAATLKRDFERAVSPRVPPEVRATARRRPGTITAPERRLARSNERRYERAVDGLDEEARRASREQAPVRRAVRAVGGSVLGSDPILSSVIARLPRSELRGIARPAAVQAVLPEPRERPLLDTAAPTIGAPSWWDAGHTGGKGDSDTVPSDIAVLGEAPDVNHPAFAGLTVDMPADPAVTSHGTAVSGVVASQDETYRGIAPGVDRLIGAGHAAPTILALELAYAVGVDSDRGPGAPDPAESVSTSIGGKENFPEAFSDSDAIVDAFGVGFAAAGGNDGPDNDKMSNTYRNGLTVAASYDHDTATPADDEIAPFSSRGPSLVGRKKPELIAPGSFVTHPDGDWNDPPSNPDFDAGSGTSLSAPQVGGALALLEGAGIGDPLVQRAILINSARDWPGQTQWRPDVGWGVLDLTTALAERANWLTGTVEEGEARFYRSAVDADDKATLAWNMRGILPENFPQEQAVAFTMSDLDLHQYRADDLSEVEVAPDPGHGGGPDSGDPNDNAERVRAPDEGSQEVIYKVKAASQVEWIAAEPYAIAATNPLEELSPPELELAGSAVACPLGHGEATITAAARNGSPDLALRDAELELELPAGVELVSGGATQQIGNGTLGAAQTSQAHTWTVRTTSPGTKVVTVGASGETAGESLSASKDLQLECAPDPTTPAPTLELTVDAERKQKVRRLEVSIGCGDAACEAELDGKAVAKRATRKARERKHASASKQTKFKLKPQTMSLAAGETRTQRVRLAKSKKSLRLLRRLLKRGAFRRGTNAKLNVAATGAVGDRASEQVVIKLRR